MDAKSNKKAEFNWEDALLLEDLLSEEERMVRDTARDYAQDKLMSRVKEANRHEKFDREIMNELGELGLDGTLRSVTGLLPMMVVTDVVSVVVPPSNVAEATALGRHQLLQQIHVQRWRSPRLWFRAVEVVHVRHRKREHQPRHRLHRYHQRATADHCHERRAPCPVDHRSTATDRNIALPGSHGKIGCERGGEDRWHQCPGGY